MIAFRLTQASSWPYSCILITRFRRYLFTYFTWKTLSNHVFEDLRKPKAPNNRSFIRTIHYHYSPLLFTITIHRYYSHTLFIIVTIYHYYSSSLLFIDDIYNYFSIATIHRYYSSISRSPQISTTHTSCCPVHLRPARPIFQSYELRWLWFSF